MYTNLFCTAEMWYNVVPVSRPNYAAFHWSRAPVSRLAAVKLGRLVLSQFVRREQSTFVVCTKAILLSGRRTCEIRYKKTNVNYNKRFSQHLFNFILRARATLYRRPSYDVRSFFVTACDFIAAKLRDVAHISDKCPNVLATSVMARDLFNVTRHFSSPRYQVCNDDDISKSRRHRLAYNGAR